MKLLLASCLLASVSIASASIFLNELRLDMPGTDNDEYVELFSDSPGSDSVDGLTLIVLGDAGENSGIIENVTSFAGITNAFASDPYFLVAEASFSVGMADFTTDLNFENSDNVTYALVEGFTGMDGDHLDTDNDGVLDVTPWSGVIDALSLQETVNGIPLADGDNHVYWDALGGAAVGPDGNFVPGHAFRLTDGNGDWAIGGFGLGTDDTAGISNVIPEPSSALLVLLGLTSLARRRRS
ncbi:PEP-CTERM sorting domain-containing protein [Verrucomicrobiales bacterium]|nr:PEP-CTERM sorting domain-containing protein [Verrucomicrobiales bacterium]